MSFKDTLEVIGISLGIIVAIKELLGIEARTIRDVLMSIIKGGLVAVLLLFGIFIVFAYFDLEQKTPPKNPWFVPYFPPTPTSLLVFPDLEFETVPSMRESDSEINQLMKDAQEARSYAHATGDTSQLASYYQDQALERSLELINLYHGSGCRLEISLVGEMDVQIEYQEQGSAVVTVSKTENRVHICNEVIDPNHSVYNDTYSAEFTVKKLNGQWYITRRP